MHENAFTTVFLVHRHLDFDGRLDGIMWTSNLAFDLIGSYHSFTAYDLSLPVVP